MTAAGPSLGARASSGLLWLFTGLVYVFMLAPVFVIVLLAFNPPEFGSFPITGMTLKWFWALADNRPIIEAIKTSLLLGLASSTISTVIGTAAAYALARFRFVGRDIVQLLLTLPILVPHIILGVGLLLAFRLIGMSKSFTLLVIGHVAITLPFVVLTTQHRLQAIPSSLEEAARTLGANRFETFREITLPLTLPAIFAGFLFAFMMSFDELTATLFWRPANVETVPTHVLGMLQYSVNQEINALATALIVVSVALPLGGMLIARRVALGGRAKQPAAVEKPA
ncbi:MAG: ABC transporter permease [Alphaproteobacteria bacterium]|nr:ABC transporter permease [Alphaproteobacteria bacterium]